MASTARSASQRATPCLEAGPAPVFGKRKRQFELQVDVLLEVRHRDCTQRDNLFVGVMRECLVLQLFGNFGKGYHRRVGASSVVERVIERTSAKRTRTVTVRPGRDLARSRLETRSARWRNVGGTMTRSSAGLLQRASAATQAASTTRWFLKPL